MCLEHTYFGLMIFQHSLYPAHTRFLTLVSQQEAEMARKSLKVNGVRATELRQKCKYRGEFLLQDFLQHNIIDKIYVFRSD